MSVEGTGCLLSLPCPRRNLLTPRPARQRANGTPGAAPPHRPGRRSVTSQRAACRCGRGGLGTQRPRRGADPGPGRPRRGGVRGGADDRRRDQDPGPHARGVSSRRVLGGASSVGGLTVLPLARPGRPRRRAAPARDRLRPPARRRAGGRAVPGRRRDGIPPRRWHRRPTRTWWARWWTGWTASCPTSFRPCAACRATHWRSPASRSSGRRPCSTRRAASRPMRRAPCSPERRRTRWSRWRPR